MNIIRLEDGTPLDVLGDRVTLKLASADSPFGQAIVMVDVPGGTGTPCVAHAKGDETYLLLDGDLEMYTPMESHRLKPGDLVHLPPQTPHGYRNISDRPARFVAWTVGGPMDRFFVRMHDEVRDLPNDLPAMQAILEEHGVTRIR